MKQFENNIKAFCHVTKIPVTYYDTHGQIQWECCPNEKICQFFHSGQDHQSICGKAFLSSTRMAEQLGEPYIHLCPSGLVKIAIALIIQGKMKGCFVAGPIAMGNNKEFIIRTLLKNVCLSPEIHSKFIVFLSDMRIFSPKEVEYLASLFNSTVLSSFTTMEDYKKNNESYKEQAHFGEQIQKYKKQKKLLDYPQELEDDLIQKVKNGDVNGSQKSLTDLLNEISLIEAGNLSFIKIRVIGLCAIMIRISSRKDQSFQVSSQEIENMDLLNKAESFKDLCLLTAKICENVCSSITAQRYHGNSSIVTKACQSISKSYMDKITLKTIAEELYTNPSYLSTLFKKEMGVSFSEYLNDIRIKRTQDLLISTNLSLMDISLRAGFDSQGYFTKVFKKKNGITPSEYRNVNQSSDL